MSNNGDYVHSAVSDSTKLASYNNLKATPSCPIHNPLAVNILIDLALILNDRINNFQSE